MRRIRKHTVRAAAPAKQRRATLFALAMAGAISLNPVYSAHAQSGSATINTRAGSVQSGASADINTGATMGSATRIANPVDGTRARLDTNRDGTVDARDARTPNDVSRSANSSSRINASSNNDASSGTLRAEMEGATNATRSDMNTRMRSDLRGATPGSVSGAGVRVNGSPTATPHSGGR